MNVGPTFYPDSTRNDSTKPPKRITWISKNPHVPGHDNIPNEDYRKTVFSSVPGSNKVLQGTITQPKGGGAPTFDGDFATGAHPDGINAKDLDKPENAKDKQELTDLLNSEKTAVDAFARRMRNSLPALRTYGNSFSAIPVSVAMQVPARIVAGQPVTFRATAQTVIGQLPIEFYGWDFGNGRGARGAIAEMVFERPGRYRVTVRATSAAGGRGSVTREILVLPRGGR